MIIENNKRLYTELVPDKMSKVSKFSTLLKEFFQRPVAEGNSYDGLEFKLDARAKLLLDDYVIAAQLEWSEYYFIETPVPVVPAYQYILSKLFKVILWEMSLRLTKNVGIALSFAHRLGGTISLLFGLCSSQSSYIFRAFFGACLSRIPTL